MLKGHNTLIFYEDKTLQRWENADNKYIYPYFAINKMPAFVLISDTEETSATVQLFDANTDVAFGAAQAVTVTLNAGKSMLWFAGYDLTGGEENCYYMKIVTNASSETYYSNVFAWTDTALATLKENNLLKISATSSDVVIGNTYNITLTGITYECYVEVQDPEDVDGIEEEGNEKPYGDIATFNTLTFGEKHEILGSKDIFRFCKFLRILKTNGTVLFTFDGVEVDGYDIICEKEDSINNDDAILMTLEYKDDNYVSSSNDI